MNLISGSRSESFSSLLPGDEILSAEGRDLAGMSRVEAWWWIKEISHIINDKTALHFYFYKKRHLMRRLPEGPLNLVVRRRRKKEEEEKPPEWRDRLLIKTRTTHLIFPLISQKKTVNRSDETENFSCWRLSRDLEEGGGIKEFLFLSSSDGSNCSEEEEKEKNWFFLSPLLPPRW